MYTDGSGQDGSAGWGWVAVAAGREVQARRGPVVVGADGEGWRGAERATNNTGELTAVLEAIEWAIGKGLREVVIRYDSEYAAHMTRGDWKAKVSKRLRTGVSSSDLTVGVVQQTQIDPRDRPCCIHPVGEVRPACPVPRTHSGTTCHIPLLRSPITTPEPPPLLPLCPTAPYHAVSWYTPSTRTRVPSFEQTSLIKLLLPIYY